MKTKICWARVISDFLNDTTPGRLQVDSNIVSGWSAECLERWTVKPDECYEDGRGQMTVEDEGTQRTEDPKARNKNGRLEWWDDQPGNELMLRG